MRTEMNLFKRASRIRSEYKASEFKCTDNLGAEEVQATAWECCVEMAKEESLLNNIVYADGGVFILNEMLEGSFVTDKKDYKIESKFDFIHVSKEQAYYFVQADVRVKVENEWMIEELCEFNAQTNIKISEAAEDRAKHNKAVELILNNPWKVSETITVIKHRLQLDYSFLLTGAPSLEKKILWDQITAKRENTACCFV